MVAFALVVLAGLLTAGPAVAVTGKVDLRLELSSPELMRGAETGLEVFAQIERGWHIQAQKPTEKFLIPTELTIDVPPEVILESVRFPPPDKASFAFAPGKSLLVYEGKVGIATSLHVPADYGAPQLRIGARLRYQACNDDTCLPPATATAELVALVVAKSAAAAGDEAGGATAAGPSNHLDVGRWLGERGYLATFLLVALLGLGLNLTPCVYPLIGVTVSFFGHQGNRTHPRRVLGLASLYVLGIALTFSVVGVLAALTGGLFGAALQRPPVLIGIAALMVVLALGSFGLYQLRPPAALMQRVGRASTGALGALFMGLTMGIVSAPCVGPVVVGLLVFVGSRQDVLLGFALFFTLAVGMGLPYLGLAFAAGSLRALPRSGEWLQWTEHLFGCVLLGLAAYFVAPLLAKPMDDYAVPLVVGAAGIYLGFLDTSGGRLRHFPALKHAVGIAAVAFAVRSGWPPAAESTIQWHRFGEGALEAARAAGQPAVLDFSAEWCLPCKEMEHTTFVDARVARAAEDFRMLKADLTEESNANQALTTRFEVKGVPTTIFFNKAGGEVERLVGYISPSEMLAALGRAAADGGGPRS